MNVRTRKSREIMTLPNHASQIIGEGKFRVRSQTDPDKHYIITETDNGLVCECPDHQKRKSDCKHIKVVLEYCKKNVFGHDGFRIMERSKLKLCKFCDSGNIIKKGLKKNKSGTMQIFKCKDCKRKFTTNFGFERRQFDDSIITSALEMYFSGMSVRDISRQYRRMGVKISHMGIYKWVAHYSKLGSEYVDSIVPRVGDWIRADEAFIRVAGNMNYLFSTMDDETRFWLIGEMADTKFQHQADKLLISTVNMIRKSPRAFITDGLPAYDSASRRVFGEKTYHSKNVHLRGQMNNNMMERLNGEIRDREKVFRGLKKKDTPIIPGLRMWYNFSKEHGGLGGDITPSEAALILVDGDNKLKTVIQNASLTKIHE